jgi:hypothetical protein
LNIELKNSNKILYHKFFFVYAEGPKEFIPDKEIAIKLKKLDNKEYVQLTSRVLKMSNWDFMKFCESI